MTGNWGVTLGALWLSLFGIWPIAHPTHGDGSPISMADALLHFIGVGYLLLYLWERRFG